MSDELSEDNFGLVFRGDLKKNNEWKRLMTVLKRNKSALNECVEKGEYPLFGYPPVLYSPGDGSHYTSSKEKM